MMGSKINVLDVNIDDCTAREALLEVKEALSLEPVQVMELVTADTLMQLREMEKTRESMADFDLILAGDPQILEAAGVTDEEALKEAQDQAFLSLVFQYFHEVGARVYLLVESEEESQAFYDYLQQNFPGIQIVGMARVSAEHRADDMLVNAINGDEVDCVLSMLGTPLQEDFIARNRTLLNAHLFLGLGAETVPINRKNSVGEQLTSRLQRWMLKREIEKNKNEGTN